MLRKRSRSHQRDHQLTNNSMACAIPASCFHSDSSNKSHKNLAFLNVPSLFVGSSNRKSPDSDSSRSPTSPLDFRIFSGFGNPFRRPGAASPNEGYPKSWDCSKVGLSIVDSLDDEDKQPGNAARRSYDNKTIIFGRQMSVRSLSPGSHANSVEIRSSSPEKTPVLPSTDTRSPDVQMGNSSVVFEIGQVPSEIKFEHFSSLDSGRQASPLMNSVPKNTKTLLIPPEHRFLGGSFNEGRFVGSVTASEIELSEDYTCVRTHGPNPKVVHIFCDCILGCQSDQVANLSEDGYLPPTASYHSNDFLKFCYTCCKKLEGQDIYMYRGEKAFCSYNCRSQEMEVDEAMEETDDNKDTSAIPYEVNRFGESSTSNISITT
ncbi:FCS-Like Zinc finger 10-like [Andrographis paniculata]|uniref:FCS-Like Zinc finger 10-like n=1 Tax=Andrographis paniculata TaxID=175694 RepID=UPI0021E91D56|nr:FCS-Like Zinc finger 10-like [Andrographis paniculata]